MKLPLAAGTLGLAFALWGQPPADTNKEPTPEQKEYLRVLQTCHKVVGTAIPDSPMLNRYAVQGCVIGYYTVKDAITHIPS